MTSTTVDELLSGPLVTWFASCLEDPNVLSTYEDLVDGILLHKVYLQINPEPLRDEVVPSCGNPVIRSKNLQIIVDNIKQFYEEELGHILLKLPNTINLSKEPELHINDMKLLLLLLLGCAVQCPNKENFITKITSFPVDNQLSIVECIKQVTDNHDIVITQESMETVNMGFLFTQIKTMIQELNLYKEKWGHVTADEISKRNNSSISGKVEEINKVHQSNPITRSEREDNYHYVVELADWKSKVRKQRQELEEKTETLIECKEELEQTKALLVKFRQENHELMQQARAAKTYRDELDAVMERAERADHLEVEIKNYRDKISDFDYFRLRVDELQEDNKILLETREMFEGQLEKLQKRSDQVLQLESEIIKYKQTLNDIALERTAENEKYQELLEENVQLQRIAKAAANEAASVGSIRDYSLDLDEPANSDNRLSNQLSNNAQARILKLELDNRRLASIIDTLKEDKFYENSSRVLELEKEKKRLMLKVDSLDDKSERLKKQNTDLELVCKEALEENRKLQNTIKTQRTSLEKLQQDYQVQHAKMIDMEKHGDIVSEEKQRIQSLLLSVQRRADELERTLEINNAKVTELTTIEDNMNEIKSKCADLESKIATMEKEKDIAQRDTFRFKETIEEKDVALDKATNTIEVLERKVAQLEQEVQNSLSQILRLQEIERSSKELDSRAAIDRETLETLQANLVAEKLNTQQLYTVLEKLGLNDTMLFLPLENILEKIAQNSEVVNHVKKSIKSESSLYGLTVESESKNTDENSQSDLNNALQKTVESLKNEQEQLQSKLMATETMSENLLSENTKLQVFITTLQSQSTSLASQHTALQLANSQLVAEKEELLKERSIQQRVHSELLHDQDTLQSLHEQLNNEYENLLHERETLKSNLRDAKNELRILRETCERLELKSKTLFADKEKMIITAKSLNNLRGEHSKLTDDFRNLYTAGEKLKTEYKNLQEEYRKHKIELNKLSLKQTEVQGELNSKTERCTILESRLSGLNQRCDMLLQMNSGLDCDRRSLMDHITLLFSQYHELLTHSLEDKEHYHMEEKMYTDKVNHLYRQKEKLEDKIMEHYRKLENCNMKKTGFSFGFVRRVKKASSELLNKKRRSWADDSKQSETKPYESESGGNDSDASTEDHQMGHAGTRRTVYYNENSPSASLPEGGRRPNLRTEATTDPRPFLIYNKVSAVINESKNISAISKEEDNEPPIGKTQKTGCSIWYEYGCV